MGEARWSKILLPNAAAAVAHTERIMTLTSRYVGSSRANETEVVIGL